MRATHFFAVIGIFIIFHTSLWSQYHDAENVNYEDVIAIQTGVKALPGSFHLIRTIQYADKSIGDYPQILTIQEIESISIFAESKRLENELRYINISPHLQIVIYPRILIQSGAISLNTNLFIE